jgi:pyruvate,water dikinase
MEDIVWFSDKGSGALAQVGGKAKNLAELERAGFPVPRGFTVTTSAYAAAAAAARIDPLIEALAGLPAAGVPTLAARIRAALASAPIDPHLARAILDAYASLGPDVPVAVRSSATAEDLASASFAGQQDTYLDMVGPDAVLDAVRRCWASLWTDRAVIYRGGAGIDPRTVRLAVVVQRMVRAATAGVLFTANPVTGRRRQAVINASPGLGEAVVSGAVNPDHWVIDPATSAIVSQRLGDGASARGACLSAEQLRALVRLGERVEACFGAPQDIEFAFDPEGRPWITQARPITTLFPLPEGASDRDLRVYFSATADEGVVRPITPMGLQAFRILAGAWADLLWGAAPADRTRGPAMMVEAALRTYYDLTPIVRDPIGRRIATTLAPSADAHTAALLRALLADPRLTVRPTPLARAAFGVVQPLFRLRVLSRLAAAFRDPDRLRRENEATIDAILAASCAGEPASPAERLARAEELLWSGTRALPLTGFFEPFVAGTVASTLVELLVHGQSFAADLDAAMQGLPHSTTVALTLDLWKLSIALRADEASSRALRERPAEDLVRAYRRGELPPKLQEGLARYLARYGHRGVAEVDLGLPRWSEDPGHLLGALANYLRSGEAASPEEQHRRVVQEGERAAAALVGRAGRLRAPALRFLLGRARVLGGAREQWKEDLTRIWARARELLLPVGEALASAGRLDEASDIFFLSIPEARAALAGEDPRPRVRVLRETYRAELLRKRVPAVYLSDGTEPVVPVEDRGPTTGVLRGTPASSGRVRAKARVLVEPTGAMIDAGEVLVAPSTDPGWTPLFVTAGGLVMERGGAISHGAVIAREYGIPAVVGVAGALDRIRTGMLLEVDGTEGTVRIVDEGEVPAPAA